MKKKKGFTLIEILVVLAITLVLATLVYVNYEKAQDKANINKAKVDLASIKTAILMLANDTGKWPGSKIQDLNSNYPSECAGIDVTMVSGDFHLQSGYPITLSPKNVNDEICLTTSSDSNKQDEVGITNPLITATGNDPKWNGPYLDKVPTDPWGNGYVFDGDFRDYPDDTCPEDGENYNAIAIRSSGKDKSFNQYNCKIGGELPDDPFSVMCRLAGVNHPVTGGVMPNVPCAILPD